jgi:hypothetical protein
MLSNKRSILREVPNAYFVRRWFDGRDRFHIGCKYMAKCGHLSVVHRVLNRHPVGSCSMIRNHATDLQRNSELVKAKMHPGTNALIKAVVNDFGSPGRSAACDDLKSKLTGSKPAEIKDKCIETLRQAAAVIDASGPAF